MQQRSEAASGIIHQGNCLVGEGGGLGGYGGVMTSQLADEEGWPGINCCEMDTAQEEEHEALAFDKENDPESWMLATRTVIEDAI